MSSGSSVLEVVNDMDSFSGGNDNGASAGVLLMGAALAFCPEQVNKVLSYTDG